MLLQTGAVELQYEGPRIDVTLDDAVIAAWGKGPLVARVRLSSQVMSSLADNGEDPMILAAEAFANHAIDVEGNASAVVGALYAIYGHHLEAGTLSRTSEDSMRAAFVEATYEGLFDLYPYFLDDVTMGYTSGWYPSTGLRLDDDLAGLARQADCARDYEETVEQYVQAEGRSFESDCAAGQHRKINRIVEKLECWFQHVGQSRPRILEVGCGWGGLSLAMAREPGWSVQSITLAPRQAEYVAERASSEKLNVQVNVADLLSFSPSEPFDAIVSVGVIEHIRGGSLERAGEQLRRLSKSTCMHLHHCMTNARDLPFNSFLGKYIFPGAHIPAANTVVAAFERSGFDLRDYEGWRLSYAKTLECWEVKLRRNRKEIEGCFDALRLRSPEEFPETSEFYYRVWLLYLMISRAAFVERSVRVGQFVFTTAETRGFPEKFR